MISLLAAERSSTRACMPRLFLRDCAAGDVVDDVFVISGKQFSTATNGKNFIKAFISDCTAQLNARMWSVTRVIFDSMPESGFLKVRGHLENYQSNLQLIIEQVSAAKDGTFDIGDLLPHTQKDIEAMCRKLSEIVGSLQNRHLAALVQV